VIRSEHVFLHLQNRHAAYPDIAPSPSVLPCGNGCSYGDSCLNVGGALLKMRSLDRFVAFDARRGIITCEAGVHGRNHHRAGTFGCHVTGFELLR